MNSENEVLLERARHLIGINRQEEAIKLLKQVLGTDPDHFEANLLVAACYYDADKYNESFRYTQHLIGIAPYSSTPFYYHALNFIGIRDFANAEKFIREAIRIDPHEAESWSVLAWIYIYKNEWQRALDYAERGLAIDPENIQCLNHKSTCLVKLDRLDQLEANLEGTLAQDPGNYYSHANAGWVQLEKGNYKKAKEHFLESLRLQPGNEPARNGVIQSLKARNWFFRLFLNYYFWVGKHKEYAQWGIIIGFYVGRIILKSLTKEFPFLLPVYILLSVLVYLTWIINPLFNLFLRMDPLGKHVLNAEEKTAANFVGLGLVAAAVSIGFWWKVQDELWLLAALYFATVLIPISRFYELEPYQSKRNVGWLTIGLTVLGATGLALMWLNLSIGGILMVCYFVGIFAYSWLANAIAIKR